MNKPFRLEVEKLKCRFCDLIFLVENRFLMPTSELTCPRCDSNSFVGPMGVITVVEEEKKHSIGDIGQCERCLDDGKMLIPSLEGMVCFLCAEKIDSEDDEPTCAQCGGREVEEKGEYCDNCS